MNEKLNRRERLSYLRGLKDGITMYAWWKDGTQYVGTSGRTLKSSLITIEKEIEGILLEMEESG